MSLPTTVLAVIWLFFAIATILMGLRVAAMRMTGKIRVDFVLAWITYFVGLAANIFCTISVSYGAGKHQSDLSVDDSVNAVRWQWILFQTYVVAHMFAKLSIIAFLLEFERNLSTNRKIILYAVAVINVGVNMSTSSLQWQQCKPVSKTWDNRVPGICVGRERNTEGGYVQGSVGAAIDVFLSVYPMVVFFKVQLDRKLKIGLCALFASGLVCAACAILKTIGISNLSASDVTYGLATLDIYSLTEMWVALVVGCIPPIKKVVARFFTTSSPQTNPSKMGYQPQSDDSAAKNRSNLYSASRSDKYMVGVTTREAFSSEESILPQDRGIMMTKTVRVDNATPV